MNARQPSLTRHLLAWALGALTLVWSVFVGFGYMTGEHEADELTDGHLASVSSLLLPLAEGGLGPDVAGAPLPSAPELKAHDYQRSISVVLRSSQPCSPPASATMPNAAVMVTSAIDPQFA